VDRLEDRWAACKTGRLAVVGSCFPHLGEEDCLRGWNGSGTIFFSHCNLRCVCGQNWDLSQAIKAHRSPPGIEPHDLAIMMLELQRSGCHNINFVTPEHVVPQVLEALAEAVELGLRLPLVYNTSGYDALESLAFMDGVVDIYMPDFKYWSEDRSRMYLKASDYPAAARAAIVEMHRQVGDLVVDANGLAIRGVLLRHLVMPGGLEETRAILQWVVDELGPGTYVNLMDQYRPAGTVSGERYPELNRRLTSDEFRRAREIALDLGLRRLDERQPAARLVRRRPATR
jgi:putative pyruvate formate lyase activating enzyme